MAVSLLPSSHVDAERLWARHMRLAEFGARSDGGVNRPALSDAEIAARAQLIAWGQALGLSIFSDGIANLFLRFEGARPDLAPVLTGSHIDSQPTGGKFDGVFGVLAGLEAIEAMIAAGRKPLRPIEIVAWTNEEGSRFAPGMAGSEAFSGAKPLPALLAVKDAEGISVAEAVARVRAAEADIPLRAAYRPAAFVEAHIEQGPELERQACPIGIVSGIQGTRRYRLRITGEAAHAGTAARAERRDALMAAVRIVAAIDEAAREPEDVKLTVGLFEVKPNAPSVVPEEVYFSIDLRHPEDSVMDRIDQAIRDIAERLKGPCRLELKQIASAASLEFSRETRRIIGEAAHMASLPAVEVYSAAGHDARQLHYVCPTGMIFVPSRGGISHNPEEWTSPAELADGARVLADTLWRLAEMP